MADGSKQGGKTAIVSDEMAKKFASEKETPYTAWVRKEGLDIIDALYVKNLNTVELKPWARREGKGVYLNHDASRTTNDCYVCEIAPGKKLAPQRMLYEEMIMILSGRGSTSVWNDKGNRITFEWGPGALFAIPLNCWHQHFNASGKEPVRFVAVTNAPPIINVYEDPEFVFNTKHDFANRFNGEPDYFAAKTETQGLQARHQLRARCGQPAADHGQGARRGRRPHPLQLRQVVDERAHLAVPDRHLQEGPPPRAGRARHHPVGRGLFADVAGGRGAALLPMGGRHHDRAAEHVVPPALQYRPDAGPLSRVQVRGRRLPQRAGRAQGLDQPAHRRRPDRLRRREPRPCARSSPPRLSKHGLQPRMQSAYEAEIPDLPPKPMAAE